MYCEKCKDEFEDRELHESHDVPTYLWEGNRKGRKNQADKFGRHWLCKKCHDEYELMIRQVLRAMAKQTSSYYFKEGETSGNSAA